MKQPVRHCLGGCSPRPTYKWLLDRMYYRLEYLYILKFVITFTHISNYPTELNPSFLLSCTRNSFKRCLKPLDLIIYILKIKCVWLLNTRKFHANFCVGVSTDLCGKIIDFDQMFRTKNTPRPLEVLNKLHALMFN